MPTKLNPGSDANLITAAYKAAVGNEPDDYSKTFEKVAGSYTKTMQASSEMWENIATVTSAIGGEMISNAKEFSNIAAQAAAIDSDTAATLLKDVYAIKDAQKGLGFLTGIFGSREDKQRKAELEIEKQKLFAEIKGLTISLKDGADVVAAGLLDMNLVGLGNGELVNAILASNLKNKVTETGHAAKIGRNERTGELMYTLYKDGKEVTVGDKVQTMTMKQFNEIIATNVKDPAFQELWHKFTADVAGDGNKSTDGVLTREAMQMYSNQIDAMLNQNPINLKRGIFIKIGYSNQSMYDDLTSNPGKYSAEIYNTLFRLTGTDSQLQGGIVEGIKDTDGIPGISSEEFQQQKDENYKIIVANLLGFKDPKVTKEYFKEYAVSQLKAAHDYGYSKKAKKPPSQGKTKEQSPLPGSLNNPILFVNQADVLNLKTKIKGYHYFIKNKGVYLFNGRGYVKVSDTWVEPPLNKL